MRNIIKNCFALHVAFELSQGVSVEEVYLVEYTARMHLNFWQEKRKPRLNAERFMNELSSK